MAAQAPIEFITGLRGRKLAPRIVINGVEGVGKTTIGAFAPDPVFILDAKETGYLTLLQGGRVPEAPYMTSDSWTATLVALGQLPEGRKTLVLDALSGFESQCHQYICSTEFNGSWSDFAAYGKGHARSSTEWLSMLSRLDHIQADGITVIVLSHAKIEKFANPMGDDFDRFSADCHKRTWGPLSKWADAVLFVNFLTVFDDKKNIGVGRTKRIAYTERRDAFDAKNRYGMDESFDLPNKPSQTWATIAAQIGD